MAKNLNIESNNVDKSLRLYNLNTEYYLRGYKIIDMEIETIKKSYSNFDYIKKEFNTLKDKKLEWIKFNLYSTQIKSNPKKIINKTLLISIALGLVVGVFYLIISNNLQSRKTSKKLSKA